MDLGEMVRAARKAVGMTQADAAKKAGVSARALWTLEKGGGHMSTLAAIADAIDFRIAGLPVGKSLGARIFAARTKRKWSKEMLARKAGISIPTVTAIERDAGQVAGLAKVLAVISTQIRTRKSEKASWSAGNRDKRYTPRWLLDEIVSAFGKINLDPCAGEGSAVVADRYITADEDALKTRWSGDLAFMNPPFSAASAFLDRAYRAWMAGECKTVIALVPVRTNTRTFHTRIAGIADVILMRGRPQFVNPARADDTGQVPFGLMLAIWGGSDGAARELAIRLGGRLMERDRIELRGTIAA